MGVQDHRGFVIDKELAQGIQVGVDNKDSVAKTLGRPTFTGQFNENDWYYVSQDTRTVAFKSQRTEDQEILHVAFDAAGNLVSNSSKLSHRVGIAWDPTREGKWTLTASTGRYVSALNNAIAENSPAGSPSTYSWFYQGPSINANANGPLVKKVETKFLNPTDYSPVK